MLTATARQANSPAARGVVATLMFAGICVAALIAQTSDNEQELPAARPITQLLQEIDDAYGEVELCQKVIDKPLRCLP